MKLSWNIAIQALATLAQLFNAYGAILPARWQLLGAGVLGGIQAIVAAVAHYYNPDGTTAIVPYSLPK